MNKKFFNYNYEEKQLVSLEIYRIPNNLSRVDGLAERPMSKL